MDELEKQIKDNSYLFDELKVDKSKIWEAIETKLDAQESKVIPLWGSPKMRVAASVIIVVGLFFMFNFFNNENYSAQSNEMNQELQDVDMYYTDLVSYQVQLVENSSKLSSEEKMEFLSFMDELDVEYNELRLELKKNINNEFILEAIIKNYTKKIELIENLLRQINNSKNIQNDDAYIL